MALKHKLTAEELAAQTMKRCSTCGKEKSEFEFYPSTWELRSGQCKHCLSREGREERRKAGTLRSRSNGKGHRSKTRQVVTVGPQALSPNGMEALFAAVMGDGGNGHAEALMLVREVLARRDAFDRFMVEAALKS